MKFKNQQTLANITKLTKTLMAINITGSKSSTTPMALHILVWNGEHFEFCEHVHKPTCTFPIKNYTCPKLDGKW